MLGLRHVEAQHGINRPVLLRAIDVAALEQLAAPLEIGLERRDQQRLAEPTWAAQKNIVAQRHHLGDEGRLVDVEAVLLHDLFVGLYADGQAFECIALHSGGCLCTGQIYKSIFIWERRMATLFPAYRYDAPSRSVASDMLATTLY